MININSLWTSLQSLGNVWRTGFLSPSKFDDYVAQASLELFSEKYLAANQTQKLNDDLSTFHLSANFPVNTPEGVNYGLLSFPSDYTYFWNMKAFFTGTIDNPVSCGCPTSDNSACDAKKNLFEIPVPIEMLPIVKEVKVRLVSSAEWESALNHRFKYPTVDNPIATQFAGGWKIAPRNLNIVTLDYYKMPVAAHFAYTNTASGYYLYDSANSIDLNWNSQVKNEFIDRILILFGVQVKNQPLIQTAAALKASRI